MEFRAEMRYLRVSPQKARLVLNLIKGRRVEEARNTLAFTKKRVAAHVGKLLQSALDNANFLSTEKGLDVDKHFARRTFLQVGLELVNFRALAADDDSRPSRLDDDADLVARPLNLDRAHARRLKLVLQLILQLNVFVEELGVVLLHKPARLPRLGVAEAKTIRMDFLSHCFS